LPSKTRIKTGYIRRLDEILSEMFQRVCKRRASCTAFRSETVFVIQYIIEQTKKPREKFE